MRKRLLIWSRSVRNYFRRVRSIVHEARLLEVLLLLAIIVFLGGTLLWLIEGQATFANPFEAIWWAVVTTTTVGYGDVYPSGISGRVAAMVVMLVGMAIVGMFTARISSVFVTVKIREGQGLQDIYYQDHIVVAGWNPGAEHLIETLENLATEKLEVVLINTLDPAMIQELLNRFKRLNVKFVKGDSTHESVLKRANIREARAVIILPEMSMAATAQMIDQRTILATMAIREKSPSMRIYAYALERDSISHLRRAGANQVVVRDAFSGFLLASHVLAPGIPDVVGELLNPKGRGSLERFEIPTEFVGKTASELENWLHKSNKGAFMGLISQISMLEMSDILSDDMAPIDAFIKRKFEEAGRNADELARNRIHLNPEPDQKITKTDVAIVVKNKTN